MLLLWAFGFGQSDRPERAARAFGVSRSNRWRSITIPRYASLACAGLTLAALLVATELEMSILLAAPGRATLGVRLYTLMHTAPPHMVNALALDMLILVAPGVMLLVFLTRRRVRAVKDALG